MATWIYTVLLKPRPLRAVAQAVIKKFIPREIHIHDVDLILNQDDAVVSGSLALGCFETSEVQMFKSVMKPGMSVLDVGSNIGLYAAIAARAVGPEGRVAAVEPDVRNCELIRKTIDRNGFRNLQVFQAAASDRSGPGELYLCANNKADHRIYGSPQSRTVVPVEFMRIDDIVTASQLKSVDVIKMDIQGAEAIAFEGMAVVLKANENIIVFMEFWPWGIEQTGRDPAELLAGIRRLGFDIQEFVGDRRVPVPIADDHKLAGKNLERQHSNLFLQRPRKDRA